MIVERRAFLFSHADASRGDADADRAGVADCLAGYGDTIASNDAGCPGKHP